MQVFDGITATNYALNNASINAVLAETVADIIGNGVEPNDVTVLTTAAPTFSPTVAPSSPTSTNSTEMTMRGEHEEAVEKDSSEDNSLGLYYTVDVTKVFGYDSVAGAFDVLVTNLTAAVSSGAFTDTMQTIAAANNVAVLASVTTANITIYLPPTSAPTVAPTVWGKVADEALGGTFTFIIVIVAMGLLAWYLRPYWSGRGKQTPAATRQMDEEEEILAASEPDRVVEPTSAVHAATATAATAATAATTTFAAASETTSLLERARALQNGAVIVAPAQYQDEEDSV